eukprot:5594768-Ditylum_brightwellii.AAC.1
MWGKWLSAYHQVTNKENTCTVLSISAHNNSPSMEGARYKVLCPYNHFPFCSCKVTHLDMWHDQTFFVAPKLPTILITELATPVPAKKVVKPKSTPKTTAPKLPTISIPKPAAPAKKTKKPAPSTSAYKSMEESAVPFVDYLYSHHGASEMELD